MKEGEKEESSCALFSPRQSSDLKWANMAFSDFCGTITSISEIVLTLWLGKSNCSLNCGSHQADCFQSKNILHGDLSENNFLSLSWLFFSGFCFCIERSLAWWLRLVSGSNCGSTFSARKGPESGMCFSLASAGWWQPSGCDSRPICLVLVITVGVFPLCVHLWMPVLFSYPWVPW